MSDIIYVNEKGEKFSAREACAKALLQSGEYIDMRSASMSDTLKKYGYKAEQEKKSILRNFRRRLKEWIRRRLMAIGRLERYFR